MSSDANLPDLEARNTFLGLIEWGQSFSFYKGTQVELPKDVGTLPVTIQQLNNGQLVRDFKINANAVNYKPKGCP